MCEVPSLEVFGGEVATQCDRIWDLDVDGERVEGELDWNGGKWMIYWDDGVYTQVLNPLQLHKINAQAKE